MKNCVFACLLLCAVAACRTEADDPLGQQLSFPLQFNVEFIEEVQPFPFTRSMPDNTIPEPEVFVSGAVPYNSLEYIVYRDGAEAPYKQRHYTENDDDFGIVYDSLPEGDYRIGFLAHSSPNPLLSEKNVFSFDSISDTFFLLKEVTVTRGEKIVADISLQRVVSRIELVAKDKVPVELAQFDVKIGNYPDRFDLLACRGVAAPDTVCLSRVYLPADADASETKHLFYCFEPEPERPVGVTLYARRADGTPYYSRRVGIRPQVNKIVRYKGYLYSLPFSEDAFTWEVDSEWNEIIENELPD